MEKASAIVALVVSSLVKLTGLYIAVHEFVQEGPASASALTFAGFLIAGGQFSEGTVKGIAKRILAGDE